MIRVRHRRAFTPGRRPVDTAALHDALAGSATVVTANRRLAAALRADYGRARRATGAEAWASPDALPYGAWVLRCWEALADAQGEAWPEVLGRVVLTGPQAELAWERAVAGSPHARDLLHAPGALALAREAWVRLQQWRLPPDAWRSDAAAPEVPALAAWVDAYEAHLAEAGWLDEGQVPALLTPHVAVGRVELPERVVFAGFDELTPEQRELQAALAAAGTTVDTWTPTARAGTVQRVALPDAETEVRAAAAWARAQLEADPQVRVGVVVPELAGARALVARAFADAMVPGALLPAAPPDPAPFNLSEGLPLSEHPVAAAALALLAMTPRELPPEALAELLGGPFVAGAEAERLARGALWEAVWKRCGTRPRPRPVAAVAHNGGASLLADALDRWQREHDALPAALPPSQWAARFDALLRALGWPGERERTSAEFQTVGKWHDLLRTFAGLDLVAPALRRGEALSRLAALAQETVFQPQAPPDVPVQVLGLLEAAGQHFDRLWVVGLHDEAWPLPPRPNPFLPLDVQRRHDMPHATAARELELAHRQTAALRGAADVVVLSHPQREGERPLRPSGLILDVPAVAPDALLPEAAPGPADPPLHWLPGGAAAEALWDYRAPPVAAGATVRGGTGLFQDQAACPFRAFAHHRLGAQAADAPEPGLTAADRGLLTHKAEQLAWARLGDHAALLAQSPEQLAALVHEVVGEALADYSREHEGVGPAVLGLERDRLTALLLELMAAECGRAPFTVVAREADLHVTIGGVEVAVRADRVDALPSGRHVIVDYKTARQLSVQSWLGDRPEEPQLPLYCASEDYDVAGVAFARLRRGESGFVGLAEDAAVFPPGSRVTTFAEVKDPATKAPYGSREAVLAHWEAVLAELARQYRAGDARVLPKGPAACRYCDLGGLCRVDELDASTAFGTEEDGDV